MTSEHIRIGDILPVIQYVANGSQVDFTFPFPIFQASDLKVYFDDNTEAEASGFTVNGTGETDGGSVSFSTAPAAQRKVTLTRELPIERTTDFQEGEFRAKVLNDEFDKIIARMQELDLASSTAMRLAKTDSSDLSKGMVLPDRDTRAGNFLSFDQDGTPVASAGVAPGDVTVSAFWGSLIDDSDSTALNALVAAALLAGDQNWTGSQRSPFVAANDAVLDFNAGQNFLITPAASAGAMSITFDNLADGQGGNIVIDNASGNANGFSWPSTADFGNQGPPTVEAERTVFAYMIQGATVDVRRI